MSNAGDLWKNSKEDAWKTALDHYPAAVAKVSSKLVSTMGAADTRIWETIPQAANKRSPPQLTRDELIFCMSYKLTRGKFRPLMKLVASNTEEDVVAHSTRALQCLKKCSQAGTAATNNGIRETMARLTKLRGVGPATASLLCAMFCPVACPFMSDEAMESVPELRPKQYTLPHYIRFAQHMREKAEELNRSQPGKWHAVHVEKALWSHARDAQISDEAPPAKKGKS